jgi:hypothetical protein
VDGALMVSKLMTEEKQPDQLQLLNSASYRTARSLCGTMYK